MNSFAAEPNFHSLTLPDFVSILRSVSPLPDESLELIQPFINQVTYPKGKHLYRAGRVENLVYFLEKGLVRAYQGENQLTFWFGMEGEIVLPFNSYTRREAAYESIQLLEPSVLHQITIPDLHRLYETNLDWANWGRKLAEREMVKLDQIYISRQGKSAAERYQELLDQHPDWVQRIQLGYLASYLDVTQVTLSRIRSDIRL